MATFQEIQIRDEQLAEEFMRLANIMSNEKELAKAIADRLKFEHRTIQQAFWRTICFVANQYATEIEGRTDLRNEASLELAKLIRDEGPALPFV